MKRATTLGLLILIATAAALAQGVTGSITGALKDTSGAMVPNSRELQMGLKFYF